MILANKEENNSHCNGGRGRRYTGAETLDEEILISNNLTIVIQNIVFLLFGIWCSFYLQANMNY